jgi:hypothetical protein
MACIVGRQKLLEMQMEYSISFAVKFIASPRCLRGKACEQQQPTPAIWLLHQKGHFRKVVALHRLGDSSILKACVECFADAQVRNEEGRKYIWNALPSVFDLGSWEELLKARDNDLEV